MRAGVHTTLCHFSCAARWLKPGQQHKRRWDLVLTLPGGKRVRPGAQSGYMMLQRSWQVCSQEHRHRQRNHTEQKLHCWNKGIIWLQTKANTHLAVVTTVLNGCQTSTSYSCQGKYFSHFHKLCSCTPVAIKWQRKIPGSEVLHIVRHWILKKYSHTLKRTDLVLCYTCILTNHKKLLVTASLNMDRLRGCTAKPYRAKFTYVALKTYYCGTD